MEMSESKYVEKISPEEVIPNRSGKFFITHMDIELTERCDNNCKHCSINIPENSGKKREELRTSEWKRIIKEAAEMGVLTIRFTGGEPLLRKDFPDLYLFSRRLGFRVIIFTNARNITLEIAKMFSEIPPLERIEISVYGMSRKTYEAVSRVSGSYDEFRDGIDLLVNHNVPFVVKGILLPDNLHEKDEFEKWAMELPWMDNPPAYSYNFELRERRDSDSKNRLISKIRELPLENDGKPVVRRELNSSTIDFLKNYIGPQGRKLFSCGAGESVSIDAYGFAHPCLTLKANEFSYNLREGTIKEAVYKFFPERLKMEAKNPEYLRRCSKCFLKGLCLQCPSRAWSENGSFDSPVEYLCRIAHSEAYGLGLLTPGEKGWEIKDWRNRVKKLEEKLDEKI